MCQNKRITANFCQQWVTFNACVGVHLSRLHIPSSEIAGTEAGEGRCLVGFPKWRSTAKTDNQKIGLLPPEPSLKKEKVMYLHSGLPITKGNSEHTSSSSVGWESKNKALAVSVWQEPSSWLIDSHLFVVSSHVGRASFNFFRSVQFSYFQYI